MTRDEAHPPLKKEYATPRVVDFGAIEVTTGDCMGLCLDGTNFARMGSWPQP